MRSIEWVLPAWEDYLARQKQDKKIFKKINELIKVSIRTPFEGIGKPEPLKSNYAGYWSRRINQEHRMVYKVLDDKIVIIACKGHYM
ncbi:Txe/YoeB family addiction module toxin [Anaerococcus urinomassiliensis]|uniref:Txe/YoeB family addiction module toxin n=1 Tax=Anaerococcus urinomassiliensis TaxID=1745712 RepID=UPI00093B3F76|nr:Txe/YoeB family addiction module toxin [Anaerococcus urinomassiliensis]